MCHDLSDALKEAQPDAVQASSAASEQHGFLVQLCVCSKCRSPPASGDKLRYCGRCEAASYCSKQCAKADWAEHKLFCESMRSTHVAALADHEARGGRKQNYHQTKRDVTSWFDKVPGLSNEIELIAWTHRGESPFIHASTINQIDADGSDVRVEMVPRSF